MATEIAPAGVNLFLEGAKVLMGDMGRNGMQLEHEDREKLTTFFEGNQRSVPLLTRALGIPTLDLETICTMSDEDLENLVGSIEDAGGVPLIGA